MATATTVELEALAAAAVEELTGRPVELPVKPSAANRRGTSRGARNSACAAGAGNGGVPAPWRYQRRIDTLGPAPERDKGYRYRYQHALQLVGVRGLLRPIDVAVAMYLVDRTHGGTRDFRVSEAGVAQALAPKANGDAPSKRTASDALDRLRALGFVDWDHGTAAEFFDEARRAMLDGRWQGPCRYRLTIPVVLEQHVRAAEAAARTATWRTKRDRQHRQQAPKPVSRREQQRRAAASNAAALAQLATIRHFADGVAQLEQHYSGDPDLYEYAYDQYVQSWQRNRTPS